MWILTNPSQGETVPFPRWKGSNLINLPTGSCLVSSKHDTSLGLSIGFVTSGRDIQSEQELSPLRREHAI